MGDTPIKNKLDELVGNARAAVEEGDWNLAATLWDQCIQNFGNGEQPWWHSNYARALIEVQRYEEAQQVLRQLVQDHPDYPPGYAAQATLALRQQKWGQAAERWNMCITRFDDGTQPGWHSNYARALIELKKYEAAEEVLLNLTQKNPDFNYARACLADLATRQQAWEKSEERWETCIRVFDEGARPEWYLNYARALIELEKFNEAECVLQKMIENNQDISSAYFWLADLAFRQKEWEQSEDRWNTLLRFFDDGSHPEWHLNYARTLIELEKYDKAEAVISKVIKNNPDFSFAWSSQANLASRRQQWELAAKLWSECIARFDDVGSQWWEKSLGYSLMQLERYKEARRVYAKLNDKKCDDFIVLENLAKISFLDNKLDRCLQYAEKIRELDPENRSGYRWAEESLIKLGRFKEAADVHLAWPGDQTQRESSVAIPDNYPASLVLPPIAGNGNDYGFIVKKLESYEKGGGGYHLPVSIIIPVYNRARMLSRTLALLTHQTYPANLIEVIVADDGSSDNPRKVVEKYSAHLNVKYVRQEDKGYRLSAARNLGIKEAKFDYFILLDSDIIPVPELVETYMKYFHVTDKAVLFGLRRYVCAENVLDDDLLADSGVIKELPDVQPTNNDSTYQAKEGQVFDWREVLLVRTNNLKEDIYPFRAFVGCNAAFPRSVVDAIGYFDEEFTSWGGEDIEYGYRIYNQGLYFIPVKESLGLHQEPAPAGGNYQVDRSAGKIESQPIFERKCPIPSVRKYQPGLVYQVPKVSIYIPAHNVSKYIEAAVDSALGQSYTDLEVVVCNDGSTDSTLSILENSYRNDPRVRWITQSNQGIAAATNAAIRACRGMYVGQLDGDDELHQKAVATMVDYLDNHNDGLVYSCVSRVDRDGNVMRFNECVPFSRERLLVSNICTPFRMFRKRDWMRISGCDSSLENAVDYDLMQKLSEICSIGHVPEVLYKYRIHGQNTSLFNRDKQEVNHIVVVNKALKRMGLSDTWLAVSGPEENKRNLRFIRMK